MTADWLSLDLVALGLAGWISYLITYNTLRFATGYIWYISTNITTENRLWRTSWSR